MHAWNPDQKPGEIFQRALSSQRVPHRLAARSDTSVTTRQRSTQKEDELLGTLLNKALHSTPRTHRRTHQVTHLKAPRQAKKPALRRGDEIFSSSCFRYRSLCHCRSFIQIQHQFFAAPVTHLDQGLAGIASRELLRVRNFSGSPI